MNRKSAQALLSRQSVSASATEELVNHNHTPGRGHPNAPGAVSSVEKEAWGTIAQAEKKAHEIAVQRLNPTATPEQLAKGRLVKWNPGGIGNGDRSYVREEEADVAKSLGAAKVGEEIRNSPHRAEVERFLDTELRGTERQAKGMPQILDEANDWARDSGLVFHTYGEMLVAARLAKMWDNSAYQAPLQTGHLRGAELDAYLKEFPITNSHTHSFNRLDGYKLQSFIQNKAVDESRSGEITVKEAVRLMKTDPVFREYVPNAIDEFASAAQHQWARSVSTNPSSLALMSTVARMRGHEFVETAPSKPDAHMADRGFDEPGKFDPATGVTVYPPINRTWSPVVPKSMGEYITYGLEKEIAYELDRGVPYEALAYGIHAASARHLADQGLNPEDTIHIYRGVRDYSDSSKNRDMGEPWERTPEQVNVTTNPLSSWSTNKIEARAFGNRMMAYDVKVKDIFATSATGFGSLSEQEIVPFGGPTDVTQVLLRSSQMGEHVPFSVERPLEFINHNHTPTSAHPNAGGALRDYKDKRMLQADEIKSIGAARGGAAIRNSPEHNKVVQEFLAQPFKDPIPYIGGKAGYAFENKLGPTVGQILAVDPLTKVWGVRFNPTTVGEALIARRLQEMLNQNGDKTLMPLDSGDIHPNEVEAHMRAKRYTTVDEFREVVEAAQDINGVTSVPHILKVLRGSGMEPFIPRAEDEFVARGQDHWANSVTGNPASIALMSRVAVSHLGMKLFTPNDVHGREYGTQEGHARGYEEFLKRAPVYDALAYGIHQASVAHFESLGFKPDDTIRIYRGMGLSPSHPIAQTIAAHPYEEPPAWYKGPPPPKLTAHTVEATMNPLSSWSTDQMTARELFGDHVLRTDIKVKDIFATAATGFGAANEFEVVPYGRGTDTYWASRSALPMSMLKFDGLVPEQDAHNYPDIIIDRGSTKEVFSVRRPLEFVNHNHTPGRGHPNAPGKMLDSEGRATKAYKQPELPKTKWIDTQRRESGFEAANLKSMGASAAGEAIRHSPKHNMAVQEFLNRPASEQIKQGLVAKYMTGIGQKYGLGTTLKGVTIGDELVIRRLDAMVSHGANFVLPLDHGHFGASNEAADYFHNPPKMQGANVSGNTIAFHINYPKEAKTLPEAIANLRRAGLAEYIPQPEHELVARMQEAWADSATTNVASVALMHAAAKQRGVPADIRRVTHPDDVGSDIVSIEHVRQEAEREYSSNSGMYDALAYGIHKASTDHLATQGVTANDHIRVYRGMAPAGATATLVRGWPKSGETVKVSAVMNPISSWTTDRETTRIFGQVAFRWDVPVKEIFATAATGFGAAIEYEVVTYGGRSRRMDVHALPPRGDPDNPGDFRPFPVAFSVERPLEFVNHNHTPTSAHPNAPGGMLREFNPMGELSARDTKAWGAARVGEAIRGHPIHRDEAEGFLSQPFTPNPQMRGGTHLGYESDLDRLTRLEDPYWHPTTIGEAFIARRVMRLTSDGAIPLARLGKITNPSMNDLYGSNYKSAVEFREGLLNSATHRPAKTVPELLDNMRKNGLEQHIPNAIDELASEGQSHWATSSTNDSASLALMATVANHQLGKKDWIPLDAAGTATYDNKSDAYEEWNQRTGVYQALAYGIHEASSQHLASIGLHPEDTVRIYRGMYLDHTNPVAIHIRTGSPEISSVEPEWYNSPGGRPPDPPNVPRQVGTTMNPISSWSTDLRTARMEFGDHTFRQDVKVKDIFATSATGFGSQAEFEVVPYGAKHETYWAILSRAPSNGYGYGNDPYPSVYMQKDGKPNHDEPFSVERALEFINRNHTPGRGHPNPGYVPKNTSLYPKDTQRVTRKSDSRPLAPGATNVKAVRGHKGMYGTDPERRIPHQGETVDIYRDLGHGREFKRGFPDDMAFSMRHPSSLPGERTNLVVASTVGVRLANPRPSWATAAKVQAEREGKRGVHAFIRGDVQEYLTPAQASKIVSDPAWQKVTYYPGTQDFFIPSTRHRVIGGEEAVLSNGQFYVRNPKIVKKPVPVSQIEKRIAEKASVTASVERRLFEEFVNRNHTKTSAHPNMNGAFLAGKREEANSPKILKGADDFYTLSSEEFKSNLRMRRLGFAGTDPVRKQVVEFISKWTGAENKISDIRAIPEEWAPAIAWMKEHAVKNDVPLYRSVQLNKDINEMVLVGERIPNRLASSFTESESYMSGFRNTRIVAEPGTVHGIPVAWLSNTPHEKEWILLNDFEAVAVRKADDGGGYDTHMLVTVKETHEPLKKWSL